MKEDKLTSVVALHEPTASPRQARVTSQPRVNHEPNQFVFFILFRKKYDCRKTKYTNMDCFMAVNRGVQRPFSLECFKRCFRLSGVLLRYHGRGIFTKIAKNLLLAV